MYWHWWNVKTEKSLPDNLNKKNSGSNERWKPWRVVNSWGQYCSYWHFKMGMIYVKALYLFPPAFVLGFKFFKIKSWEERSGLLFCLVGDAPLFLCCVLAMGKICVSFCRVERTGGTELIVWCCELVLLSRGKTVLDWETYSSRLTYYNCNVFSGHEVFASVETKGLITEN